MKKKRGVPVAIPFLYCRDEEAVAAGAFSGRGAVGLIISESGEVLLNLRDNKAGIVHPGCWSVLGGLCEAEEDEETTLRRELFEEAALVAGPVFPAWRLIDWEGRQNLLTAFIVPTVATLEQMRLGEGQDLRFFHRTDLRRLKIPPVTVRLLQAFFESRDCRGTGNGSNSDSDGKES